MDNHYFIIVAELVGGFIAFLIITRIFGRTTISQISTFDFIGVLILGDLVGSAMYAKDASWKHMIVAIGTWTALIYSTALITQKSRKSRSLFEGTPQLIIYKGVVSISVMKKNLLDLEQLSMLLRVKDIFSISEVEHAVLESNGAISVIKKSPKANTPAQQSLSYMLIQDGELIKENLTIIKQTEAWLENQIREKNFSNHSDIFFAEWNNNSGLLVQGYLDNKK